MIRHALGDWRQARLGFDRRRDEPEALPEFDGRTYSPPLDRARLSDQLDRVRRVMADGAWRTLKEIGTVTGDEPQSVSARLRDLRKPKFGGHSVERRRRGPAALGIFEYRVVVRA